VCGQGVTILHVHDDDDVANVKILSATDEKNKQNK